MPRTVIPFASLISLSPAWSGVVSGQLCAGVGNYHGEKPRRLGGAGIGADDMVGGRRLPPAFSSAVYFDGAAFELRANRTGEYIGKDEARGGVMVRRRGGARRIIDDHGGQALPRNIRHDLFEDLACLAARAGRTRRLAGSVPCQHRRSANRKPGERRHGRACQFHRKAPRAGSLESFWIRQCHALRRGIKRIALSCWMAARASEERPFFPSASACIAVGTYGKSVPKTICDGGTIFSRPAIDIGQAALAVS